MNLLIYTCLVYLFSVKINKFIIEFMCFFFIYTLLLMVHTPRAHSVAGKMKFVFDYSVFYL